MDRVSHLVTNPLQLFHPVDFLYIHFEKDTKPVSYLLKAWIWDQRIPIVHIEQLHTRIYVFHSYLFLIVSPIIMVLIAKLRCKEKRAH